MVVNGEVILLDACPFCGENLYLSMQKYESSWYYARCDRCLSNGPFAGSIRAAAENWNARPKHDCKCKHDVSLSANVGQGVPF